MAERHLDLIDRQALLAKKTEMELCFAVSEYDIANAPRVDAVEVVHGRWVKRWHDNNLIGHEYEECSVCGSCVISDTEKFWDCNYCPQCGAKMDGGETDGSEG